MVFRAKRGYKNKSKKTGQKLMKDIQLAAKNRERRNVKVTRLSWVPGESAGRRK